MEKETARRFKDFLEQIQKVPKERREILIPEILNRLDRYVTAILETNQKQL